MIPGSPDFLEDNEPNMDIINQAMDGGGHHHPHHGMAIWRHGVEHFTRMAKGLNASKVLGVSDFLFVAFGTTERLRLSIWFSATNQSFDRERVHPSDVDLPHAQPGIHGWLPALFWRSR